MSTAMNFDSSQRAVIDSPWDERLLVIAAAGQGKTAVLVERLKALEDEGLDTADEVVVLSFSRAAVDMVRQRAGDASLHEVKIKTFDSFAAEIIRDFGDGEFHSYDHAIRKATQLIDSGEAGIEHVSHVIIDEVQDLVSLRAELTLSLLRALPEAGFTLLGDPLQGLYDFQMYGRGERPLMDSSRFLDICAQELDCRVARLSGHYRARSTRARQLVEVGDELRVLPRENLSEAHRVIDEYRHAPGYYFSGLDAVAGYLEPDSDERIGILAATNYELLKLSEKLFDNGYEHVVRRRAETRGYAGWIASTLGPVSDKIIKFDEFTRNFTRVSSGERADDAWNLLKSLADDSLSRRELDLDRLARAMASRPAPQCLAHEDAHPLVLSTVHRAKGLEFDVVIDLEPHPSARAAEQDRAALNRKYVASTRARDELFVLQPPSGDGASPSHIDGRWCEMRFFGKRRYLARFEVLPGDFSLDWEGQMDSGFEDLAHTLGRTVDIHLIPDRSSSTASVPRYAVLLDDGRRLLRSTDELQEFLIGHYARRDKATGAEIFPQAFHGARVTAVESVAVPSHFRDGSGYFRHRVCLGGFVRSEWPAHEKKDDAS